MRAAGWTEGRESQGQSWDQVLMQEDRHTAAVEAVWHLPCCCVTTSPTHWLKHTKAFCS